jgi:predicted peptidase
VPLRALLTILSSNRLYVRVLRQIAGNEKVTTQMMTRREAVRRLGSASAGAWFAAAQIALNFSIAPNSSAAPAQDAQTPPLASGAPKSPQRIALIEAFQKQSDGLEKKFEARTHKSDWVMPYRLFRPEAATGKLPLVVFLHGSGGSGTRQVPLHTR